MRLLLYSGVLYLAGIALALVLKPDIMFRSDGSWKEFGIGRNPDNYTWFPFWIFAIVWAISSYILIIVLASFNLLPGIIVANDGELVNNTNLSGLVYSSGDDAATLTDMRNMAEEMTEVPLKTPDVTPIITDINSIPSRISQNTSHARAMATGTPNINLKNGYYILNTEATRRSGIPKYIYLGPEPPKVLYR
jgi:hypothetical protein